MTAGNEIIVIDGKNYRVNDRDTQHFDFHETADRHAKSYSFPALPAVAIGCSTVGGVILSDGNLFVVFLLIAVGTLALIGLMVAKCQRDVQRSYRAFITQTAMENSGLNITHVSTPENRKGKPEYDGALPYSKVKLFMECIPDISKMNLRSKEDFTIDLSTVKWGKSFKPVFKDGQKVVMTVQGPEVSVAQVSETDDFEMWHDALRESMGMEPRIWDSVVVQSRLKRKEAENKIGKTTKAEQLLRDALKKKQQAQTDSSCS